MSSEASLSSDSEEGHVSFESLLTVVGGEGWWQRRVLLLTATAPLLMGLHSLASVAEAAAPDHWCALPEQLTPFNLSHEQYIPSRSSADGQLRHYECNMFNISVTPDGTLENTTTLVPCQAGYQFDLTQYGVTAAVAWELVCWRSPLVALLQSSFMLGVLLGCLVSGVLSDLFGRRAVALAYSCALLPLSLAVAAAPSFPVFVTLRALLAVALPGPLVCLMVLCLETCSADARGLYGILFQTPVALGLMLAAAAGWVAASWWQLQLLLSAPALLLPLLTALVPESPRWLLGQGRLSDAADVLVAIARGNGRAVDRSHLQELLETCRQSETAPLLPEKQRAPRRCCAAAGSDILQLVATPRLRRISLACFWCLFVAGLASYGLAEDAAALSGDAFTALLLSGAVELLADAGCCVMLGSRLGRRPSVSGTLLVSALASLTLLAVSAPWARLTLAMAARCTIAAALNILAFYSAEVFPTSLRSTGFGVGATVSRLGAVVAPLVVGGLGTGYWGGPAAVFGACALTAGLVALLMPETRGKRLPDTVQDVEMET